MLMRPLGENLDLLGRPRSEKVTVEGKQMNCRDEDGNSRAKVSKSIGAHKTVWDARACRAKSLLDNQHCMVEKDWSARNGRLVRPKRS